MFILLLPFVQLFLGCAPRIVIVWKISFDGNGMRFLVSIEIYLQYAMVQRSTFLYNLRKEANIEELKQPMNFVLMVGGLKVVCP